MRRLSKRWTAIGTAAVAVVTLAGVAFATTAPDFGSDVEHRLNDKAKQHFGVKQTLGASSPESIDAAEAEADPTKLVTLAKGLHARVVTTASGPNTDMIAFWPNDESPTHLIVCNEQGPEDPGVQRIDLATGATTTIVTGTQSCDPARRTPWGTIVFAEETSDGQLYELIDPLATTGVTLDRDAETFTGGTGSDNFAVRTTLGQLAFEGLGLLPNGVLYYGDELRPDEGTPGGAYFKFIPTSPWVGGDPITDLADSPFASGAVHGLRIGMREVNTDYGQGNNTGQGLWVPVCSDTTATPTTCGTTNPSLRDFSGVNRLTGYYRPEDLEVDPAALAIDDVRLCGANTGIEEFRTFGEVVCLNDGDVGASLANSGVPEAQYFVVGTPQLAMPDNLAFQPGRNNLLVQEDGDQLQGNNDIFSCLPDGTDSDLLSDGCARVLTLNDLEAETTGGIFNADGSKYYVSIQHNVTGHGVVLEITGWR